MDDFDYSGLDPAFAKLAKPAQRALLNNGIKTPEDLSKKNLKDVLKLHGMGKGSVAALKEVLHNHGLDFAR